MLRDGKILGKRSHWPCAEPWHWLGVDPQNRYVGVGRGVSLEKYNMGLNC